MAAAAAPAARASSARSPILVSCPLAEALAHELTAALQEALDAVAFRPRS